MKVHLLGLTNGDPHELADTWLVSYDPNHHTESGDYDGGDLVTTRDKEAAHDFPDIMQAIEAWKAGPTCRCHRLRPDGLPNRPLTAFNVEVL